METDRDGFYTPGGRHRIRLTGSGSGRSPQWKRPCCFYEAPGGFYSWRNVLQGLCFRQKILGISVQWIRTGAKDRYFCTQLFTLNFVIVSLMKALKHLICLWMGIGAALAANAQTDVARLVKLKEFVVSAGLEDLDVADFIRQVEDDTTFYQAFLNLRYYPHDMTGAMVVYNKDESERGTLQRKARQFVSTDDMMWVKVTYEKTNGKIKKRNGDWKYLTAEMYDEVFFPTQKQKVSNRIVSKDQELVSGSSLEKHKAQLKRMLFNPGAEIENVPLIGDKMAIFSDKMMPYYHYSIYPDTWADSVPCVVFSCYAQEGEEDKTVIRDMTTYFHRDTHEVIARKYRLAHNTILFDFDITMEVENKHVDGRLVPRHITYSGMWNIPFKRPEIISFQLKCHDYTIPR